MPIERYASGGIFEDEVGYSRVVVADGSGGRTGWTAGCTSLTHGLVQHPGDPFGQARVSFQTALFALERAGFARADTVLARMYVVDLRRNSAEVGRAHAEVLGHVRPAATMVGTDALVHPDLLVEVELVAWRPSDTSVA